MNPSGPDHSIRSLPGLGEALAQWIVDGKPPMDLSEISLERFAGHELPEDELRRLCREAYAHHYRASSAADRL